VRQFALRFRHCFAKPQFQHFVTVLLGLLLCLELRNLSGIYRSLATSSSVPALSRFLAQAPWNQQQLVETWLLGFRQQLAAAVQAERARRRRSDPHRRGRLPKAVVTGYLIGDDSTMHKPKGKKMQAIGRHYSTTARKPVPGHSMVTGLYLLLDRRVPLEPQLYRTKKVAAAEGVEFRDKLEIMVGIIMSFEPVADTATHVVLDSWYASGKVWRAAKSRGFDITCGLKSNRSIKVADEEAAKGHKWVGLPAYAASLSEEDYELVKRPTAQGGVVYVHVLRTWVRKLGVCRLVILRESLEAALSEARYWASSDEQADAAGLVGHISARWQIEVLFSDSKDLLGLDQYQLMSAQGIVRWWTLVLLTYVFLEEQRHSLSQGLEQPLTIGETRAALQRSHRHKLIGWMHEQFMAGVTPEQMIEMLAA
jgi:hypothetical protein